MTLIMINNTTGNKDNNSEFTSYFIKLGQSIINNYIC